MDVDTNWCLYCGKKTEGTVYCSKYCHNLDKNKKQRFSNEFIGNQKVQKEHSEIISHSDNYCSQYSLKFKNRINSCNTPITRNTYCSINQYNPYWMLLSDANNDINEEKKLSFININEIEKGKNNLENNDKSNDFSKINENKEMKIYLKEKNLNIHSEINTTQSILNCSSFDDLKDDSTTLNKLKSIFSLFYKKNNSKRIDIKSNTPINKENIGILKCNEPVLNLSNNYFIQKSVNSYSSCCSIISNNNYTYNKSNNNDNNNNNNEDAKANNISSSSNNKYIKNKDNTSMDDKYSKISNYKSLSDSSPTGTSNVHFSSNTEVAHNSENVNSYLNSINQLDNKMNLDCRNKNLNQNNQLNNNRKSNVNLKFKNLYLSRAISQKIPAKNIEYLKNYKRQIRRKSNELSIYSSNNEYTTTLYSFKPINEHFPKQFRKMTISLDNQSLEIKRFKDNTCINKHFKDIKRKLEKIHHKKNATIKDYILTIECLNTISTDENTIKSVKKSSELIENIKNKNSINRSLNINKNGKSDVDNKSFIINTYNNYPRDVTESDTNQFITNNEVNPHYDNIDSYYTFEDIMNMNKNTNELEKQKQDLQQQLIQQIRQQSRYYQENKIDYSYSCTTLSSFTRDESYSIESEDEYEFPDITKNYYETVIVSSNPMSSITSLSFKKNKDNSLSIIASYSSIANRDLKKLNKLYNNNINTTLEQIKIINDNESTSNSLKYDMKEDNRSLKSKNCSIQLKKEEFLSPIFQNNTLMTTSPEIYNVNFKLYYSEATESVTSSFSISTESNTDSNYIYYDEVN